MAKFATKWHEGLETYIVENRCMSLTKSIVLEAYKRTAPERYSSGIIYIWGLLIEECPVSSFDMDYRIIISYHGITCDVIYMTTGEWGGASGIESALSVPFPRSPFTDYPLFILSFISLIMAEHDEHGGRGSFIEKILTIPPMLNILLTFISMVWMYPVHAYKYKNIIETTRTRYRQ